MIRKATLNDAETIAKVHVESCQETYSDLVPAEVLAWMTNYESRLKMWNRSLTGENFSSFVALDEAGKIVGFVSGGKANTESPKGYDAEVYTLYMLRCQHGKGLGRKLMAAVASNLHQKGFKALCLWVLPSNPSRLFYEHLGGKRLLEKSFEMAGATLSEQAYGWPDIRSLMLEEGNNDINHNSET
jgi:L-amino acid N-acyltransferase YncA